MEFRKVFDTIPEQFDKYRPRYSAELFSALIEYAEVGPGKTVLELGPGTGKNYTTEQAIRRLYYLGYARHSFIQT